MNDHMAGAIAAKRKKALEIKLSVDPETHEVSMEHSGAKDEGVAEDVGVTPPEDAVKEGVNASASKEKEEQESSDLAPSVKDAPGSGDASDVESLKKIVSSDDYESPSQSDRPMGIREKAKSLMKKKVVGSKK